MWSVVSSEIKECNIKDSDALIVPNMVIDALGKQEISGGTTCYRDVCYFRKVSLFHIHYRGHIPRHHVIVGFTVNTTLYK